MTYVSKSHEFCFTASMANDHAAEFPITTAAFMVSFTFRGKQYGLMMAEHADGKRELIRWVK